MVVVERAAHPHGIVLSHAHAHGVGDGKIGVEVVVYQIAQIVVEVQSADVLGVGVVVLVEYVPGVL